MLTDDCKLLTVKQDLHLLETGTRGGMTLLTHTRSEKDQEEEENMDRKESGYVRESISRGKVGRLSISPHCCLVPNEIAGKPWSFTWLAYDAEFDVIHMEAT